MRDLDPKTHKSEFIDHFARREKALQEALKFRTFEIELYWKRATYFWTFIGAVFAGYGASQTLSDPVSKEQLSVFASCLGLVFSFAWYCVNRGSKQWQENWEFHVDLLEDAFIGPLYKTVIRMNPPASRWGRISYWIWGAGDFSVTKINQIVSLFVTAVWVVLLWKSLPLFRFSTKISWIYGIMVFLTASAVFLILRSGRTKQADKLGIGTIRNSSLHDSNNDGNQG